MLRTKLVDGSTGIDLHTDTSWDTSQFRTINPSEKYLITETTFRNHGTFASTSFSGAGTTTVLSPTAGGTIVLTDLILTGDRVQSGNILLQFTDGTQTVDIVNIDVTDAPVTFAIPFSGRWQGWKDARIDLTITNSVTGNVALGYMKTSSGLPYTDWNNFR